MVYRVNLAHFIQREVLEEKELAHLDKGGTTAQGDQRAQPGVVSSVQCTVHSANIGICERDETQANDYIFQ